MTTFKKLPKIVPRTVNQKAQKTTAGHNGGSLGEAGAPAARTGSIQVTPKSMETPPTDGRLRPRSTTAFCVSTAGHRRDEDEFVSVPQRDVAAGRNRTQVRAGGGYQRSFR